MEAESIVNECTQHIDQSLFGLLDELKQLTAPLEEEEVRHLLLRLAAHKSAFAVHERFSPDVYQRNRIFRSDYLDILLLCWRAGQRTPIHNHAGSVCGVFGIRGEGTEIGFTPSGAGPLIPTALNRLCAGDITVSRDEDIHFLANFSSTGEDLVTLHCYSPPLSNMRVFTQSETFFAAYDDVTERASKSGCYTVPLAASH